MNNSFQPIGTLPRPDLREKAFRKYERYINRALHESYTIDAFAEFNMRAQSVITRFKDAILGFRRYRYESSYFKHDAPFDTIKLYEQADGTIKVVNLLVAAAASQQQTLASADEGSLLYPRDWERIRSIMQDLHDHKLGDSYVAYVRFTNDADGKFLKEQETPTGNFSIMIDLHAPGLLRLRQ